MVAIFCNRILDGQPLTMFGDGEQTRDYVFVKDVARAIFLAATRDAAAAGAARRARVQRRHRHRDIVIALADPCSRPRQRDVPIEHAPKRPGEQQRSARRSRRRARLGWEPQRRLARRARRDVRACSPRSASGAEATDERDRAAADLQIGTARPDDAVGAGHDTRRLRRRKIVLGLLAVLSLVSWAMMLGEVVGVPPRRRAADGFVREFDRATRSTRSRRSRSARRRARSRASSTRAMQLPVARRRPRCAASRGAHGAAEWRRRSRRCAWCSTAESERGARLGSSRFVPWLATIGSVSPLIGLLGTVLGIISAFIGIATKGSGNIAAVAPGVAEALIATAAALAVAIPAVFGYNIFANRVNRFDGELDGFGIGADRADGSRGADLDGAPSPRRADAAQRRDQRREPHRRDDAAAW